MAPVELFSQLCLWWWINVLYLTPFASILSYIYMCGSGSLLGIWIRIQKAPEYESGSTTLGQTTQTVYDNLSVQFC